MSEHQHSGWRDLFNAENRGNAITLSSGVVLSATNSYIVITILPSVVEEIGGMAWYAWNTTLYVVSAIMGAAFSARVLRKLGPRNAYLTATGIFMLGALICALAPAMPVLLLGRTVQGMGGGLLTALSYAMINLVFSERLWPRAMALISAMWGIATLVGPAVGGIFAELHAWRYAFGSLVPLTLLFALLIWKSLPAQQEKSANADKLPIPQLVLLAGSVLVVSASSLSASGWVNLVGFIVTLMMVGVLRKLELTSNMRLLPKNALTLASPLCWLYLTMALLMIGMECEIYLPYFLQHLHGQTPLMAGYITAAAAAGWTISEMWSSGWTGERARKAIIWGPVVMVVSLVFLLTFMPVPFSLHALNLSGIVIGLTLLGFATGLGWPHLLTRVLQRVEPADKDIAGASITVVQSFAVAMGAALAGTIANLGGVNLPDNQGTSNAAFWLLLLLIVAPAAAMFTALRATRKPAQVLTEDALICK